MSSSTAGGLSVALQQQPYHHDLKPPPLQQSPPPPPPSSSSSAPPPTPQRMLSKRHKSARHCSTTGPSSSSSLTSSPISASPSSEEELELSHNSPQASPVPATPPASPPSAVGFVRPSTAESLSSSPTTTVELPPSPPSNASSVEPSDIPVTKWVEFADSEDGTTAKIGVITAHTLGTAIDRHYSTPLPAVETLFPWLHGLDPDNTSQRAFLDPKTRKWLRTGTAGGAPTLEFELNNMDDTIFKPPGGVRGLMVIKVGDEEEDSLGTLVGSIRPKEILSSTRKDDIDFFSSKDPDFSELIPKFFNLDPKNGISLRNFHIQVAKWATLSDLILYSPDPNDHELMENYSKLIAQAQHEYKNENPHLPEYNTYVVYDSIDTIMEVAPHIVAVPPKSLDYDEDELRLKNWDSNFLFHERIEMSLMSSASPIGDESSSVWLGNNVDFETYVEVFQKPTTTEQDDEMVKSRNWATFIECFDGAQPPTVSALEEYIDEAERLLDGELGELTPLSIHFPGSGCIPLAMFDANRFCSIISLCKLIYLRSQVTYRGEKAGVLLYCNDGYSETALLALMYIIYSTGAPASEAWVDMHTRYNRPFFCFRNDITLATMFQAPLHEFSPAIPNSKFSTTKGGIKQETYEEYNSSSSSSSTSEEEPEWYTRLDGSAPSRILPHMYLGSLVHAENPEMLRKIGIKRVLSVGEVLTWVKLEDGHADRGNCGVVVDQPYDGFSRAMHVGHIEDDGIDPLMNSLSSCLDFLDEGYRLNEPTLVHCRVGVSRSATVCIAEVMKRLGVGLPRAYLFVRVRRLSVIIQPNLRFMYELVKWEELHRKSGEGWLREVDWHVLCRDIAAMNKAYIA